jgi:nucleoside-diphosphate-sugar epimerase
LATHFVTGGTGVVGRALIAQLLAEGETVAALGRSPAALRALADAGAQPIHGDLATPGVWQYEAADADVVWHVGLPRTRTPLRRSRVGKEARAAWRAADHLIADRDPGRPVVVASNALVWGGAGVGPVTEATDVDPVGTGHWALAAEEALARTPLRTVRLGWTYGPQGMFTELVTALRARRYRIVGPGGNLMPLISADDAALALRAAAAADPGIYAAAEAEIPTQEQLIHHVCAELGVTRPDRLSPRMAAFGLGSAMVDALSASIELQPTRLAELGWAPRDSWRAALVPVSLRRAPVA